MAEAAPVYAAPVYASLFSGAGGLDLGLEMAGWQTAYASDIDHFAVDTLRANAGSTVAGGLRAFSATYIERADVRTLDARTVLAKCGRTAGSIDLLAGGPPCQSWSSAGRQLGFEDPRGRLLDEFVRVANALDVRWLLMENVRGLLTARGADGRPGSALAHVRYGLLRAGFQTTVGLLNAADFGVPQRRVRLFIVGFRTGDAPPFPLPVRSKGGDASGLGWVPLGHALASVGPLSAHEVIRPAGKLAVDLVDVPEGSGVKSPGKAERTRPNGHWGYKQGAFVADRAQSARTVTASSQQDWVRDPAWGLRRLCPRECAAIQSFPPGWIFSGSQAVQYRLIGNAVPPRLGAYIGRSLMAHAASCSAAGVTSFAAPLPLPERLAHHIAYTAREEASNGRSRREAPQRRIARARPGGLLV